MTEDNVRHLPTPESTGLYMLRLVPERRQALFVYPLSLTERCTFTVHEETGVVDVEGHRFINGGNIAIFFGDEHYSVSGPLGAQALRITQVEYANWDDLRIHDRVQLQITWARDALKRAEQDMLQALSMPYDLDPSRGSWDPTAIIVHVEGIQQCLGELDGLYAALACL
jgi:hypothetical protein